MTGANDTPGGGRERRWRCRRPNRIDAVEFLGGNCPEVYQRPRWQWPFLGRFYVVTGDGRRRIDIGDFVVNGADGFRRPCRRDTYLNFAAVCRLATSEGTVANGGE